MNSLFPKLFLDSLRIRQRHTYKTELQKIKLKKIEGNREVEFNKELEKIFSKSTRADINWSVALRRIITEGFCLCRYIVNDSGGLINKNG